MSDTVDVINNEFDDYQSLLCLKEKKLKLLVDFVVVYLFRGQTTGCF